MLEYVITHGETIFALIGALVSCASLIVKLTPTTKDDSILEKVINFIDYFSVFNTKKNQAKIDK
jgi:hypothetical protein